MRFDVFAALAHYTSKQRLSIRDDKTVSKFVDEVRGTTAGSLKNDAFVYGFRVQAMFETVVASLGKVQLLKQEDAGSAYYAGDVDLAIPDYRVVLNDGTQLLVEVKNFAQTTGREPYVEDAAYLKRLNAYAAMTGATLLIAVYWHGWNIWTLVPPASFVGTGRKVRLALGEAMAANQMSLLGDMMIGTKWPLRLRMEVDNVHRNGDERTCRISRVTLHSEDRPLDDPIQRRIATFLIFNGSWQETTRFDDDPNDPSRGVIELSYAPEPDRRTQAEEAVELMGSLSSMISTFFRRETLDEEDDVKAFHVDFSPGEFGKLIPDDYPFGSAALPLLLVTLEAQDPSSAVSSASTDGADQNGA